MVDAAPPVPGLSGEPRQIGVGHRLEPILAPRIEGDHQVAGKALDESPVLGSVEPSSSSQVASGKAPGI